MRQLKDRIAFVKSEMGWSNAELARQAGTSRTAPTDWLKGEVGELSSSVAQRLSLKTPFSAMWLATGAGPMYQGDSRAEQLSWPFTKVTLDRVLALSESARTEIEEDLLYSIEKAERKASGATKKSSAKIQGAA